ncbi:MAG: FkbM family methyltransferase [Rhodothermales bacterium]
MTEFERFGHRFKFFLGDRVGEMWFEWGGDTGEIAFLWEHMVEPGDVIFECGAHHGELTVLFAHRVGQEGKVVAFEPVPRNVEILERQVELNGFENVQIVPAAVGQEPGQVRITDESNAQVSPKGPGIDVPVVRLDDYLHLKPTLLKIDVEGFEATLLKGAQQVLATKPKISLEIHTSSLSRYGTSAEEILELVGWESYEWWRQFPGEDEVLPWDREPVDRTIHIFGKPIG